MNVFETEPETLPRQKLISLVHDPRGRVDVLTTKSSRSQAIESHSIETASLLGLSPAESRILAALMLRERLTHIQVQNASCSSDLRNAPTLSTVKVQVCHLRRKIEPTGAHIITIWGYGYQIIPSDKAKIKDWVEAQKGGQRG